VSSSVNRTDGRRKDGRRRVMVLVLLAAAQLIGVLDFSIVNVALPSIGREFHLSSDQLQWVVSAYALTLGGFLLLGGRVADLIDRRLAFMAGLTLFSVASLAGGLSPTPALVFVARAAQGLGGAVLAPVTLAMITAEFPEGEQRNRALGVYGTMAAVGFSAGAMLGGLLTGLAGWRWVFFVNVPIGMAALAGAALLLRPQPRAGARARLDVAGAALATAAMVALVGGLSQLPAAGGAARAALLGGAAAVLLAAFLLVERSAADPLVPLDVFRSRLAISANLVAGLAIVVASGLGFTLTVVAQREMGTSPLATGLAFLPAGVGGILGGSLAGAAVGRVGFRLTAAGALTVLAVGVAVVLALGAGRSIEWLAAGYGVAGVGIVGTVVATTIAATAGAGPVRAGLAAGLLTTAQQVGGALGAAVAGVIDQGATSAAYDASLAAGIAVALAAAALALAGLRAPEASRHAAERARTAA
jgi:EmrB/QacA subfamily drug resistance transporter